MIFHDTQTLHHNMYIYISSSAAWSSSSPSILLNPISWLLECQQVTGRNGMMAGNHRGILFFVYIFRFWNYQLISCSFFKFLAWSLRWILITTFVSQCQSGCKWLWKNWNEIYTFDNWKGMYFFLLFTLIFFTMTSQYVIIVVAFSYEYIPDCRITICQHN